MTTFKLVPVGEKPFRIGQYQPAPTTGSYFSGHYNLDMCDSPSSNNRYTHFDVIQIVTDSRAQAQEIVDILNAHYGKKTER